MFKNPFSFKGRIRRTEFGLTQVIGMICLIFFQLIGLVFIEEGNNFAALVLLALFIPVYWVMISQGAKRCHDLGNSGWYQLIPFYIFWMLFDNSQLGTNEYGPNPKGIGNYDEIDELGNYLLEPNKS